MNERIEHCMYQSGLTAQGCWDELDDYAKQAIEKMAELIVRECAKSADEWYQNHNDIHWDPAQHIKNHFGVEE